MIRESTSALADGSGTGDQVKRDLVYHEIWNKDEERSVAELAFDEIVTDELTPKSFNKPIDGGFRREGTAHLHGSMPAGQAILHFDGSVTWRKFNAWERLLCRLAL